MLIVLLLKVIVNKFLIGKLLRKEKLNLKHKVNVFIIKKKLNGVLEMV